MEEIKKKFGKIYDQYNAKIYRFIYLKVSSRELAEDLASEVFLRAWRGFIETEIQNIQAYIYQIARNVVADHYERKRVQTISVDETIEIADPGDAPEDKVAANLEMERVRKALQDLNDDYQNLIIWRYLDELSVPEIAQITGKTEENVRVGVHRALQALRERLV